MANRVSLAVPGSKDEASQNWKLLMTQNGIRPPRRRKPIKKPKETKESVQQDKNITKDDSTELTAGPISQHVPGFPIYDSAGRQVGGKVLTAADMGRTWCLGMDCEMVGVGPMNESALARVSIVNEAGYCLFDKFVKPKVKVTDYRTAVSGVRKSDLDNAQPFDIVVWQVSTILKDRVVVGHALGNDFRALLLNHPKQKIRDTSLFYKSARRPALKFLARKFLNLRIQEGEHNSILDAQVAMKLYLINRKSWEQQVKTCKLSRRRKKTTAEPQGSSNTVHPL